MEEGVNMDETNRQEHMSALRQKSHMPPSMLFERIIPIVLIVLGIIMAALVLFAAGVLLGIVHF